MRSFLSSSNSSILCLSTGSNTFASSITFCASPKSFVRLMICFYISSNQSIIKSCSFSIAAGSQHTICAYTDIFTIAIRKVLYMYCPVKQHAILVKFIMTSLSLQMYKQCKWDMAYVTMWLLHQQRLTFVFSPISPAHSIRLLQTLSCTIVLSDSACSEVLSALFNKLCSCGKCWEELKTS